MSGGTCRAALSRRVSNGGDALGGMSSGLPANSPAVVAAFDSTLLAGLLIGLAIAMLLGLQKFMNEKAIILDRGAIDRHAGKPLVF